MNNDKFMQIEKILYNYDQNPTEEKRNEIILLFLNDYKFSGEMLGVLNTILKLERGGFELMSIIYEELGMDINIGEDEVEDF